MWRNFLYEISYIYEFSSKSRDITCYTHSLRVGMGWIFHLLVGIRSLPSRCKIPPTLKNRCKNSPHVNIGVGGYSENTFHGSASVLIWVDYWEHNWNVNWWWENRLHFGIGRGRTHLPTYPNGTTARPTKFVTFRGGIGRFPRTLVRNALISGPSPIRTKFFQSVPTLIIRK
jgi:hypothetical protein